MRPRNFGCSSTVALPRLARREGNARRGPRLPEAGEEGDRHPPQAGTARAAGGTLARRDRERSCTPSRVLALSPKGKSFHVQARSIFAYETGLRPETLDKLLARDVPSAAFTCGRSSIRIAGSASSRSARAPGCPEEVWAPWSPPTRCFGEHDYREGTRGRARRTCDAVRPESTPG